MSGQEQLFKFLEVKKFPYLKLGPFGNPIFAIDADMVSSPTRTKNLELYLTSGSVVSRPRAALQIMEWIRFSSVLRHLETISWSIESMALQEI